MTTKTCACGVTSIWKDLPLVGHQRHREEDLEMRNCPCGSTMALQAQATVLARRKGSGVTIPFAYRSLERALEAYHAFEQTGTPYALLAVWQGGVKMLSVERF